MNIRIFIPYFGRFPSYFPFFLKSCGYNPEIDFLIFTDQELAGELPQNVKIHNMSFESFKKMAQSKLALDERNLKVLTPYKLCDYRPAYGVLFSDYLRDADFWGFCDVDLIFGRIFDVLSMEIMQDCDRVLNQGHLTLYRNTPEINHLFEKKLDKGISFRDAIKVKEPCFFDEIFMPEICRQQRLKQYGENRFADILPQFGEFVISPLCSVANEKGQSFYWENGRLYQHCTHGDNQLMYIHLQKRRLPDETVPREFSQRIYITPQGFYTQGQYSEQCNQGDRNQRKMYQKKRLSGLTMRKVWIKFKVLQMEDQLR